MSIGIFFLVFAALLVIGTPICLVFSDQDRALW